MNTKYSNFPQDPENPGWIKGWGVFRNDPWDFAGLFLSKEEANDLRNELGTKYQIKNGSHRIGSDDFVV